MKHLLVSLFAFVLISGQGELIPASRDRPFYASSASCNSVASAIGNNARCKYVSVPMELVV